ncbi:MAG: amidohydrolase [Calditrichaeota bacterium]|nr:MAG: amidohydrolase [Calditrichota bacterium]
MPGTLNEETPVPGLRIPGWYLLIACLTALLFTCTPKPKADLILVNGRIFQADSKGTFVEALAVKDGSILAAGRSQKLLQRYRGKATRILDLHNRLVVPGFHDAHLHMWNGARLFRELNLIGLRSKEAVLKRVAQAVKKAPPGSWVVGRGWDHELWPDRKLPDKRDLDRISREHYIYLKRVDGHAAWVNSAVLKLLRYNAGTEDPPGGKIMRYPHSREPNGLLFETAFRLLDRLIPEPTPTQKRAFLRQAIQKANRLGITAVCDFSPDEIYPVYKKLYQQGELTLRIHFGFPYRDELDTLQHFIAREGEIPRFLDARMIKMYADGSLGSRTAYLLAPYLDDPENRGLPRVPFQQLLEMVQRTDQAGFQIAIHAIGDGAVRMVLDAFDSVATREGMRDRRWRIEHSQVLDSADFSRYRTLGVVASMQPSHCITDMHWAPKRIGRRVRWAYAWRRFLNEEVLLAFGTDWPVEPLNPMVGLYAAVTRKDTTGYPPEGWTPEERLTLAEAIRAYTAGSAQAAGWESWNGTLNPGKVADFVVLDRNVFEVPPEQILRTRVLATFLAGRPVYLHPDVEEAYGSLFQQPDG